MPSIDPARQWEYGDSRRIEPPILAEAPPVAVVAAPVGRGGDAYNSCMLHDLPDALRRHTADRTVLLANHLLSAEPSAAARLAVHRGRTVRFAMVSDAVPSVTPALHVRITPAGLLERLGPELGDDADLSLLIDLPASALGRLLTFARSAVGEPPAVRIVGDAALAADVDWCLHNVRWDAEHDLGRLLGDAPARQLVRAVRWVGDGLRAAVRRHVPPATRHPAAAPAAQPAESAPPTPTAPPT